MRRTTAVLLLLLTLPLTAQAPLNLGHEVCRQPQVIEGVLKGLSCLLRLAAITRKALLGLEVATLSGFGPLFGMSLRERHGALLRFVWILCGGSLPSARDACPRPFVSVECSLRHAPPVFPASFCRPCAVYIRLHGLSHSHTVFCTPHRPWEGGR